MFESMELSLAGGGVGMRVHSRLGPITAWEGRILDGDGEC